LANSPHRGGGQTARHGQRRPDFGDHPKVINGCSDLFVETLGDAGRHARSAVGMGSLPNGIMVEIEAILLIRS
jgi:enamine deaminase RidA (YjgF/YER057c/UK114 family)